MNAPSPQPQRQWFTLVGGPLHKAKVFPPAGELVTGWKFTRDRVTEVHSYALDWSTYRGKYLGSEGLAR